jgi:hypothetical protein
MFYTTKIIVPCKCISRTKIIVVNILLLLVLKINSFRLLSSQSQFGTLLVNLPMQFEFKYKCLLEPCNAFSSKSVDIKLATTIGNALPCSSLVQMKNFNIHV